MQTAYKGPNDYSMQVVFTEPGMYYVELSDDARNMRTKLIIESKIKGHDELFGLLLSGLNCWNKIMLRADVTPVKHRCRTLVLYQLQPQTAESILHYHILAPASFGCSFIIEIPTST